MSVEKWKHTQNLPSKQGKIYTIRNYIELSQNELIFRLILNFGLRIPYAKFQCGCSESTINIAVAHPKSTWISRDVAAVCNSKWVGKNKPDTFTSEKFFPSTEEAHRRINSCLSFLVRCFVGCQSATSSTPKYLSCMVVSRGIRSWPFRTWEMSGNCMIHFDF